MDEMWRLFIAIELPAGVVDGLAALQARLKKTTPAQAVKWVPPQGIHLTLKFLGDYPVERRDLLEQALSRAVEGMTPFGLAAHGLGCFPNANKPRVIWVGLERDLAPLGALRDAVEAHVAPLGYPTEARAFSPHLTLGRVRQEARREDVQQIGQAVTRLAASEVYPWQVTALSLIRSELKPSGAVYTPLFHAPLKALS